MEMAFLWFAEQKVDVAVIEVGLGGRLDSTNIISPDLSIITNIGFDHMQYLGNTLPAIAAEKAGIIKPFTPVVIGEMGDVETVQVFTDKAKSVEAPIVFAELYMNNFASERSETGWLFRADGYPDVVGELKGPAQDRNARTVLTAVEVLLETGYNIPKEASVQRVCPCNRPHRLNGTLAATSIFPENHRGHCTQCARIKVCGRTAACRALRPGCISFSEYPATRMWRLCFV